MAHVFIKYNHISIDVIILKHEISIFYSSTEYNVKFLVRTLRVKYFKILLNRELNFIK